MKMTDLIFELLTHQGPRVTKSRTLTLYSSLRPKRQKVAVTLMNEALALSSRKGTTTLVLA